MIGHQSSTCCKVGGVPRKRRKRSQQKREENQAHSWKSEALRPPSSGTLGSQKKSSKQAQNPTPPCMYIYIYIHILGTASRAGCYYHITAIIYHYEQNCPGDLTRPVPRAGELQPPGATSPNLMVGGAGITIKTI